MLVLPWYIRFAIDTAIIATPFIYLHRNFPLTQITQQLTFSSTLKKSAELVAEEVFVLLIPGLETQNRLWGEK